MYNNLSSEGQIYNNLSKDKKVKARQHQMQMMYKPGELMLEETTLKFRDSPGDPARLLSISQFLSVREKLPILCSG